MSLTTTSTSTAPSSSTSSSFASTINNFCEYNCIGSNYCLKVCSLILPYTLKNIERINSNCIKSTCASNNDEACTTGCIYKDIGVKDEEILPLINTKKVIDGCNTLLKSDPSNNSCYFNDGKFNCFDVESYTDKENAVQPIKDKVTKSCKSCDLAKFQSDQVKCQVQVTNTTAQFILGSLKCQESICSKLVHLDKLLSCGAKCSDPDFIQGLATGDIVVSVNTTTKSSDGSSVNIGVLKLILYLTFSLAITSLLYL